MNATVTLPIGDLDKLRNDLKENQEKVKFFEKNEKVVKLVVREHTIAQEVVSGKWDRSGYGYPSYYRAVDKYLEKEPEYINFEDVKAELKKEAESATLLKIGDLERANLNLQKFIQDKETEHNKTTNLLKEEHKKAIETLKEANCKNLERIQDEHKIEKTKLKTEIKILKGEDVDTEQEKKIKELTKQIADLRGRGFLERMFNI